MIPVPLTARFITALIAALLVTTLPSPSHSAEFRRVSVDVEGRVRSVLPGDFDGDGLTDLAVAFVHGVEPRETRYLTVFWQTPGGDFQASASALEVPETAALVDVGVLQGKDTLLLMAYDGVDAIAIDARELSAFSRVLNAETMVFHGELGDLTELDFASDLFHDGVTRMAIPQWGKLSIAEPAEDGFFDIAHTVDIPQQAFYTAGPVRYGMRTDDYALSVVLRAPRFQAADMDRDGQPELVLHVDENVFVYGWDGDTLEAWPRHVRHFAIRSDAEKLSAGVSISMLLEDINGDAVPDVILNKISGGISAMKSRTEVYLGRSDLTFAKQAARVYEDEGYASSLQLVDLNGDGITEVIAPIAAMGLWQLSQIAMSGKIELTFRIYEGTALGPVEKSQASFDATLLIDYASGAQLKSPAPTFAGDFNGDGQGDLLISRGDALFEAVPTRDGIVDVDQPIAGVEVPISRHLEIFNSGRDDLDDVVLYYPYDKDRSGRIEILLLEPTQK